MIFQRRQKALLWSKSKWLNNEVPDKIRHIMYMNCLQRKFNQKSLKMQNGHFYIMFDPICKG